MKLPAYPCYKPSGVEWLGDVPAHWELKRAASLGRFSSSGIDKKWVDGETPVQMFNYLDVYRSETKTLRYSEELMWTTAEPGKIREHSVRTGDILITPSSETEDDIGHAAHVIDPPPNIVYSYHLVRFRLSANCDARYLAYSINAPSVRSYFESVCSGTTRMVLVRDDMRNARFALPPVAEQRAIAAFLDRETGRMDALVAKKRELIERLKEKRTALISRTVTRGLPPAAAKAAGLPVNPPLKPSGLNWLGEIPEHWEVVPLRYAFYNLDHRRIPVAGEDRANVEKIYPYYGASGIIDHVEDYLFDETLILVAEDGANLLSRSTPLAFLATGKYWVNNHAHILKPVEGDIRYWAAVLQSYDYTPLVTGAAQPKLTSDRLGSIRLPQPPPDEQTAIAAYLDLETAKLDALVGKVEAAVERLQEYRTALITAAVTGKIDVRAVKR